MTARSPLYGACGGDAASLLKTREAAAQFLERLREKYPNGEPKRKGKRKGKSKGERRSFHGTAAHIISRDADKLNTCHICHRPPKSF